MLIDERDFDPTIDLETRRAVVAIKVDEAELQIRLLKLKLLATFDQIKALTREPRLKNDDRNSTA